MTDLSEQIEAPGVTESLSATTSLGAPARPGITPVRLWAALGGLILAFRLDVGGRAGGW